MKRLLVTLFAMVCLTVPSLVFAAPSPNQVALSPSTVSSTVATSSTVGQSSSSHAVNVRPIRGSFSSHSFGSRSFGSSHSFGSRSFGSRSFGSRSSRSSGGGTYSYHPYASRFGGFHFGSLMTGFFLGRLLNPFGFGYGYGAGLGLFHIVIDIFIIWILFRLFSRFRR